MDQPESGVPLMNFHNMYIDGEGTAVPWNAKRYAETVVQLISLAFARITQPTSNASFTRAAFNGLENVWNWPPSPVLSSIPQLL